MYLITPRFYRQTRLILLYYTSFAVNCQRKILRCCKELLLCPLRRLSGNLPHVDSENRLQKSSDQNLAKFPDLCYNNFQINLLTELVRVHIKIQRTLTTAAALLKGTHRAMFKYQNVMASTFALYFFATTAQIIYSLIELPAGERNTMLICGAVLFVVPLVIFLTGKLKRLMPYLLATFYVISCFVMSLFNKSEMYLPILFSIATVFFGFFLSSKLSMWYLALSDIVLLATPIFFFPSEEDPYFIPIYTVVFVCYTFSGLGMSLFVQAVQSNFITLKRENKKLKTSDRRKNLFWAASSGRMRSSAEELSQICGTLLERSDIPVSVREKLSEIQTGTSKLFMTLNDAEDYALTESKRMVLNNEPYRFDSLVTDISRLCTASCPNENIDILIDCQSDIPSVLKGDSRRITQVIMNLFENSVKYTESGSITISFSARKTDGGVNLQIGVTDTGRGINEKASKKMFTVYAENGSSPAIHLGLGISKELISLMGGFIFARREKTGGSRFTLTVPQDIISDAPFAKVEDCEKLSALLYIKSEAIRTSAAAQLEKMGVSCEICRSRSEFMMKKDEAGITHIFCDYGFYTYDKPIFDILAKHIGVTVICGTGETEARLPKNIQRILMPVSMASFAYILGSSFSEAEAYVHRFAAPDAKVLIVGNDCGMLKNLEQYRIRPFRAPSKNVIGELQSHDFDLIFVCEDSQGVAAKIMVYDDGMYMRIPVIDFGGSGQGCSDILPTDYKPKELEKLLENFLPESVLQYSTAIFSTAQYEELDPEHGMLSAGESPSVYRERLEIFEEKAQEFKQNIDSLISSKKTEDCMLLLDGIKSSAAEIGAASVSESAMRLCVIADSQNWALLSDRKEQLLYMLNRLQLDIDRYFSENGVSKLSQDELREGIAQLKLSLHSKSGKLAYDILHSLTNRRMTREQRNTLNFALKYINTSNSEKALEQLEKLISRTEEGKTQ